MDNVYVYIKSQDKASYGIFKENVDNKDKVTFTFPVVWKVKKRAFGLISTRPNTLNYVCLFTKGRKVVSTEIRIKATNFIQLVKPITSDEIEEKWDERTKFPLKKKFKDDKYGLYQSMDILRILKEIIPEQKAQFEKIERLVIGEENEGEGQWITHHTRDAISLGLSISGIGRENTNIEISTRNFEQKNIPPFLKEVKSVSLLEDKMIEHDTSIFSDYKLVEKNELGIAKFKKGKKTLNVWNVNRHKIETLLGVDLIYYDHRFNSYTLVQYKRMLKTNGGKFIYRPDSNYEKELERMKEFLRKIKNAKKEQNKKNYRFHNSPFFFKFCPEIVDINRHDLVQGMYLPIDYLEILHQSNENLTQQGNFKLTYDNVLRHFNNTDFITLVKKGWIGTTNLASDLITEIINDILVQNRKVVLAEYKIEG